MSPPAPTREFLTRLPKAELHCHLDGSLRPETMLELAAETGVSMPASDAESLREFMQVRRPSTLDAYLQSFTVTLSVLQTSSALERAAYELAEDAAAEGVRYIEVRYAPILNRERGLSLGEAVEAPLRGLARAEREYGITGRVILCAIRNLDPDVSLEMARLAVAYRKDGVVGFDLAGGEAGSPATRHAAAFAHARENDVACTCHAGEGAGAESVRDAVHGCCVHRVGHGTRLFEDESLLEYVNDRRIPLEICLTSNVQTGAATTFAKHPLRQYFDLGLNVVLNTDNRLMSGVTLVDEYQRAAEHLGFTAKELAQIALNGFESAFLPWPERGTLIAAMRREIDALLAGTGAIARA